MTFDTAERCGYNTIHHGNSHQKIQYCIAGRFPFAKAWTLHIDTLCVYGRGYKNVKSVCWHLLILVLPLHKRKEAFDGYRTTNISRHIACRAQPYFWGDCFGGGQYGNGYVCDGEYARHNRHRRQHQPGDSDHEQR